MLDVLCVDLLLVLYYGSKMLLIDVLLDVVVLWLVLV